MISSRNSHITSIICCLILLNVLEFNSISGEEKSFKEIQFKEVPMIVWEPTNIPTIIGRKEVTILMPSPEKRCSKWDKLMALTDIAPNGTTYRIARYIKEKCTHSESFLINELAELRTHIQQKHSSNSRISTQRSKREVPVESKTMIEKLSNETVAEPDNGILHFLSSLFTPVHAVIQHSNEDSNYNQVWKHSKLFKMITPLLLEHEKSLNLMKVYNNRTLEMFDQLIRSGNSSSKSIEELTNLIPEFVTLQIHDSEQRQRYRELINVLRTGYDRKLVYIDELLKVFPKARNNFDGAQSEFTRLLDIEYYENGNIYLVFEVPRIDPNVTIYNGYFLKKWLGENQYIKYDEDRNQFMFNASSNCSRWTEKEQFSFCTVPTKIQVTPFLPAPVRTINDKQNDNAIVPVLISLEDRFLIQCYHNKIILDGKIKSCPKFPFELDRRQDFIIKNFFQYAYKYEQHANETDSESEEYGIHVKPNNAWQEDTNKALAKLEELREVNYRLSALSNATQYVQDPFELIRESVIGFWFKYPMWTLFIITATSLTLLFSLYFICRKDQMVKIFETSIMASAIESKLQRSASIGSLSPASAPNVHVIIPEESRKIYYPGLSPLASETGYEFFHKRGIGNSRDSFKRKSCRERASTPFQNEYPTNRSIKRSVSSDSLYDVLSFPK